MDNQTDQQLLRAYVSHRSEAAFTELVHRYIDLVYSTSRRLLGDAFRAEDVTQATFMALAQNAKSLANRAVLSGWLHTTAHHLAIKTIRTDARRQQREKEAVTMNESAHAPTAVSWQEIAPHLDALIGELAESERDAILLRYFEKKSAAEMAATLGISADAAQKRVNRAVEKLRSLFSKHGINIGSGGLGILISTHAVQAAPAGLALTISSVALAGTAATTSTLIAATKTMARTTLQKTLVTTTVAVLAGVGLYEAKQALDARTEVLTLRQQQALLEEQVQSLQKDNGSLTNRISQLGAESMEQNDNSLELLRLRGAITRLRNENAQLAEQLEDWEHFQSIRSNIFTVLSNTPPVRTFTSFGTASLNWDQTLVTGGWKTPSGKRAIALITAQPGDDSGQLSIKTKFLEYTEAAGEESGLARFNFDVFDFSKIGSSPKAHAVATDQLRTMLEHAERLGGINLLAAPEGTAPIGRHVQFQEVGAGKIASGEVYHTGPILDFIPTVAPDGRSATIEFNFALSCRIPFVTPSPDSESSP